MSRISHDICDLLDVPHRAPDSSRRETAQFIDNLPGDQPPTSSVAGVAFSHPLRHGSNPPMPSQRLLTSAPTRAKRRIILAGGSGFLGGLLASYFNGQGWEVVVLSRRAAPDQVAGDVLTWDGRTLGGWTTALDGADAVINLAGRSVNCRYHAHNRRLMMDSRVDATRVIGEAIARCANPPRVWLNFSTSTIYKHTFCHAWDEAGEIGATPEARDAFSIEVATAWESAFNAAPTPRTRKVALRSAMVFGLNADANNVYRVLRRLVRFGLGGCMGSGRQFVSWIHEADFCRAVEFLIERDDLSGPVNLAAPNPLTNAEMMRTLRKVLRMPVGLPPPNGCSNLAHSFSAPRPN